MKRLILLLLLMYSGANLHAQQTVKPTLGVSLAMGMLSQDAILLNDLCFEPGIKINDRVDVQLSIGYLTSFNRPEQGGFKCRNISTAINASMRLLKSPSGRNQFNALRLSNKLSPLIGISVGSYLLANENPSASGNPQISERHALESINRFYAFAKVKYMFDILLNNTNIRIGPTYSGYLVNMTNTEGIDGINFLHGYGIEFGIVQTLNLTKRY